MKQMVPLDICFASASGKSEYEDFRKSWREYKSKHSYELQSSDITGTVRRFLSPEALKAVDHCISVTAGASRGLSYTAACINEEMIELQLFWYSEGGLGELKIEGVITTAPLHQRLVEAPEIRAGAFHTRWLEQWLTTKMKPQDAMMEQSSR